MGTTMSPFVPTEKVMNWLPIYNFGNKICPSMHSWRRSTNVTLSTTSSIPPRRMDSMWTMFLLPGMEQLHWKVQIYIPRSFDEDIYIFSLYILMPQEQI